MKDKESFSPVPFCYIKGKKMKPETKEKIQKIWDGTINLGTEFLNAKATGLSAYSQNAQNVVDLETAKIDLLRQQTEANIKAKERADKMKTVLVWGILIVAVIIVFSTMSVKMKKISKF